MIRLTQFALLLAAILAGGPALARPLPARATRNWQALFSCHADTLYLLQNATGGDPDKLFVVTSRQRVDEEISLTVDVRSRRLRLVILTEGGPAWTHALSDVEQGKSSGSGAGGKADTTIRGRDGTNVFTLFAQYDNNGFDHDAALQVSGTNNTLLTCDSDFYAAPQVKGLAAYGSTNIYGLAADGLAAEMKDVPAEPDVGGQP